MILDFITPNPSTVSWIDTYCQYHDNRGITKAGEIIADNNYNSGFDGWYDQPSKNIESAFYEFKALMVKFEISEDDINNQ